MNAIYDPIDPKSSDKNSNEVLFFPVLLLVITCLSYGLRIFQLGFYWDDWLFLWAYRTSGVNGLIDLTKGLRPILGYFYTPFFYFFDDSKIAWQIFGLISRYVLTISIWWSLTRLWPEKKFETAMISLLVAVYPGFTQQAKSISYSNHLLCLGLYFLSFGLMIAAQTHQRGRKYFIATSLICIVIGVTNAEYYLGLELLRPFLLWNFSDKAKNKRTKLISAIKFYYPFFILTIALLIWKLWVWKPLRPGLDHNEILQNILNQPILWFKARIFQIAFDIYNNTLIVWLMTFLPNSFFSIKSGYSNKIIWLMIVPAVSTLIIISSKRLFDLGNRTNVIDFSWIKQIFIIGLFAISAGGFLVWFTGRHVIQADSEFDRYTLPMMLGSCLLMTGIIILMVRNRHSTMISIAILCGLATGSNNCISTQYVIAWEGQKSFLWQLSWRAPSLKPGTAIVYANEMTSFSADYQNMAEINLLYDPSNRTTKANYWAFSLFSSKASEIKELLSKRPFSTNMYNQSYLSEPSGIISIATSGNGCLRVIDPCRIDELPILTPAERSIGFLSNLDRIVDEKIHPARPLVEIFGAEPEHGWCYFYQKADLARQIGDWAAVISLGDKAISMKLNPADVSEWFPFIEGYARMGHLNDAMNLSRNLFKEDGVARLNLCNLWSRIGSDINTPPGFLSKLSDDFSCRQTCYN